MKKTFFVFIILALCFMIISIPVNSKAATLTNVSVKISKEKVAPGGETSVTVSFGKNLGAYTVNVAYDKEIFDYVRSQGGTANNEDGKVILTYHDETGGTNPRTNAVITFKAKENLTASNPTNFLVTLEGMANSDASERYDDILTPYTKDVLVEPNYEAYNLKLDYTGTIKKGVAKDMKLTTSSAMGKNYDHVRLIAEVTKKPSKDATAKILATKTDGTKIDLLQSGWGEENGYAIGGKNVKQQLALSGEFSNDGKYTINIKLIDRDNSDKVIAQKDFDVTVGEKIADNKTDEKLPATYPTTGTNKYAFAFIALIVLVALYWVVSKKNKR